MSGKQATKHNRECDDSFSAMAILNNIFIFKQYCRVQKLHKYIKNISRKSWKCTWVLFCLFKYIGRKDWESVVLGDFHWKHNYYTHIRISSNNSGDQHFSPMNFIREKCFIEVTTVTITIYSSTGYMLCQQKKRVLKTNHILPWFHEWQRKTIFKKKLVTWHARISAF